MTVLSAAQSTLIGRLWPQTAGNGMIRAAALILIGSVYSDNLGESCATIWMRIW